VDIADDAGCGADAAGLIAAASITAASEVVTEIERVTGAGTADGITRCKAGIAIEATKTAVQADSNSLA
jgi:hypothetical protein